MEFSIRVLNFFKIICFRPWNVLSGICRLALACRARKVPVAVTSDAHFAGNIGKIKDGMDLLKEIDYPESLIIGATKKSMEAFLCTRRRRLGIL